MGLEVLESESFYPHLQVRNYLAKTLGIDEWKLIPYLLGHRPLTIEEAARFQLNSGGKLNAKKLLQAQRLAIKYRRYNFK